jgi:hypothetical protein
MLPLLLEFVKCILCLGGLTLFLRGAGLVAKREFGEGEGDGLLVKKAFF